MGTRRGVCRNCERLELRLAELERQLAAALARIAELEGNLAAARKDSSTSSKPPSSDIVKPPPASNGKPGRPRKRRVGGQPGHARHVRSPFPPEQVDRVWNYVRSEPEGDWEPLDEFRLVQQVELREKRFDVVEHRAQLYRHVESGRIEAAPLPREVVHGGLVGPRLTALLAYQKGACHMSYLLIQRFCSDVLGLAISTGELVKLVHKASAALEPAHEEVRCALPRQSRLNIDETGHGRVRPPIVGVGLSCARSARLPLRRARPQANPRNPRRRGTTVVRTHLDRPGNLRPKRPLRLPVPRRIPSRPLQSSPVPHAADAKSVNGYRRIATD
jgi:hypothetical protein